MNRRQHGTPRNEKPVVIAGGGIGGLACALGLVQRGFRVTVLEQAQEFGELGAGIQLGPNAFHVFDALGVGKLVKKDAVFIERILMMDGVSGEKVIDIPIDARFRRHFGNPYAVTHRADIHGALLEGCRASGLVELRTRSRVTGFHNEASGVSVELDGGERMHLRRDGGFFSGLSPAGLATRAADLSPNALLRPVMQDYLLPTVAL
ncbi:MAG: NAD(P)-binding protein, partial [Gammaproteobacteria bacterium]|nr:NAD(P)-binding protein [Gammaproteobacteria bacterium]